MQVFKKLAASLPNKWQDELKRLYFSKQIRSDQFITDEPEYKILHQIINEGDWIIDIGANVGHYTKRFSDLVGPSGRVIAFEPVPTTFSLLSANSLLFSNKNITLINSAVSERLDICGMSIPTFSTGLTNFYEAHLTSSNDHQFSVLTLAIDTILTDRRVALIKIDTEGHEAHVLKGMRKLIDTSRPILIVETDSNEVINDLVTQGYTAERLDGSPNILFQPIK